jgi:hypothetical protein
VIGFEDNEIVKKSIKTRVFDDCMENYNNFECGQKFDLSKFSFTKVKWKFTT